jgi:hypothetical protein
MKTARIGTDARRFFFARRFPPEESSGGKDMAEGYGIVLLATFELLLSSPSVV